MRLVLLIFFHFIFLSTFSQDTLKVTYYNLLNFPSSQQDRIDTLVKILDFILSKFPYLLNLFERNTILQQLLPIKRY